MEELEFRLKHQKMLMTLTWEQLKKELLIQIMLHQKKLTHIARQYK